jgi:hypothetical protein
MLLKPMLAVIVIATLATLAWRHRDSTIVRDWALGQLAAPGDAGNTPQTAPADGRSAQNGKSHPKPAVGVRKCLGDGKFTYTNEACPPGSREQAFAGTLTVMSFPSSTTAQPATSAASRATIRDLAGNPSEDTLTDKRIDESFAR